MDVILIHVGIKVDNHNGLGEIMGVGGFNFAMI